MTTPTYTNIFTSYYRLYRAEATVPTSTDDEYTIGLSLANEAIARWANYEGIYWKDLFSTLRGDRGGTQTITTSTKTYLAPPLFREAGGFVKVLDASNNTIQSYPIIEPQQAQFKSDNASYAYFTTGQAYYSTGTASQSGTTITGSGTTWTSAMTGMQIVFVTGEVATITFVSTTSLTADVTQTVASGTYRIINYGYTLNINPVPPSSLNGLQMDYVFYKRPTELVAASSRTECPNTEYIVHRMLANRFRASRNPYYTSALRDAEDALQTMKLDNDSGSWANPWKLQDNSGAAFGDDGPAWSF